jgi:hypothetical protein
VFYLRGHHDDNVGFDKLKMKQQRRKQSMSVDKECDFLVNIHEV